MYLLDTNSVIYLFKGMGNIAQNLFAHSPREVFIPSIVVYEFEVGISKSTHPKKRKKQLQQLLSEIDIINFTHKEAKEAAKIRASLEKIGEPIASIDTLIAGMAKANNLTLITRNIKEFSKVQGLEVEDWF